MRAVCGKAVGAKSKKVDPSDLYADARLVGSRAFSFQSVAIFDEANSASISLTSTRMAFSPVGRYRLSSPLRPIARIMFGERP